MCKKPRKTTGGSSSGSGNKPAPEPAGKTKLVGWYDLTHYTRPVTEHLEKARRSSNLMYMRTDRGEWQNLLPYAAAERWPAVILMARERDESGPHHDETARAAQAIIGAGLNLRCIIMIDEADLRAPEVRPGVSIVHYLNNEYDLLKAELDKLGLAGVKVAETTWSLASPPSWTWKDKLDAFGVPKGDILVHDSWYCGRMNELHNVRHRFIQWADYMRKARGNQEIIHVIKAWSKVPPDLESITPEWVLAQMKCIAGTGTTEYDWTNPNTGETARVILEPLPAEYQGDILLYKMDDVFSEDSDNAGGNRPDIIGVVDDFCRPRGWTMK